MYLGLDLGTSSLKATILDHSSNALWVGTQNYDTIVDGERVEMDPLVWWAAAAGVLSSAPSELLTAVESVGLSGQMHGIIPIGESNQPIHNAILWLDRRALAEVDVFAEIDHHSSANHVNPIVPGMAGPILLWLQRHDEATWNQMRGAVGPKDWLRSMITDESPISAEPSDASATLLYDIDADDWSDSVLKRLGLDAGFLPNLIPADSTAGYVSSAASSHLGIPEGIPVAAGAGDVAAALLGLGIEKPGNLALNVGTGAQVAAVIDLPDRRFSELQLHQYRTASSASPWYVMVPVLNAGLALGWVRSNLGLTWEQLFALAEDALTVTDDPVFLPFVGGERDPEVGLHARGSWTGLSTSHDRSAMARSALLGVATYLARRVRLTLDLTGSHDVILSGGSSKNREWVQLLATMIGRDVGLVSDTNASARGAAILAARSVGSDVGPVPVTGTVSPQIELVARASEMLARMDAAL